MDAKIFIELQHLLNQRMDGLNLFYEYGEFLELKRILALPHENVANQLRNYRKQLQAKHERTCGGSGQGNAGSGVAEDDELW